MKNPPPRIETSTPKTQAETPAGLRMRIWLGCLGGVLLSGAGMWWIVGTQGRSGQFDASTMLAWLAINAALGILVGTALAMWLSQRLITHVKGLTASLATGNVAELRGLPAVAGWGELSDLTQRIQDLIVMQSEATRAVETADEAREQLDAIRGARERHRESARRVAGELDRSLDDAREAAEQAERGFVEATALLTTVRELQRLGGELDRTLAIETRRESATVDDSQTQVVRAAIEDLVTTSVECVDDLAAGLLHVREIVGHVHVLGNRATLIALEAATGAFGGTSDEASDEMRRLAGDVRHAVDSVSGLSRDVETRTTTAIDRMRTVRERVARRLEETAPAATTAPITAPDFERLTARVREMIQDAAQKGERLATASERVSSAAERLTRGLESETGDVRELVLRLSPTEVVTHTWSGGGLSDVEADPAGTPGERLGSLRLLGRDESDDAESEFGEERT